jgi:hypothetical protein
VQIYFESLRFQNLMVHRFFHIKIYLRNAGKIAWSTVTTLFSRSPAESPSTRYTSHFAGSCSEQSEISWQSTATHYGFTLYHFTLFLAWRALAQELLLNNDSSIIWIFFQFSIISLSLTYRRNNFYFLV